MLLHWAVPASPDTEGADKDVPLFAVAATHDY